LGKTLKLNEVRIFILPSQKEEARISASLDIYIQIK